MRRTALSGIPEASPPPPPARTITPGPNAFALRAAEVDAHRLQSNAFYQQATAAETARLQTLQDQEMAARLELAPPTTAHPALRENFHLGDSFLRTNLMANQAAFTQAESSTLKPGQSPPLQLLPEEGFQANPTDRSVIEGFHEELEPNSFRGALLCGDCTVAHSRRCVGLSNGLRPVGVSAVLLKVLPVTYIQIIFGDAHSEPRPRIHHAEGQATLNDQASGLHSSGLHSSSVTCPQSWPSTHRLVSHEF